MRQIFEKNKQNNRLRECYCAPIGGIIYVQFMQDEMYTIPVDLSNDTIGRLKERFSDVSGIPVSQMMFESFGRHLEDNCKLSEYDIGNEHIIQLILRFHEF